MGTPYCSDKTQRLSKLDEINLPEENSDKTIVLITLKPENRLNRHNVLYEFLFYGE